MFVIACLFLGLAAGAGAFILKRATAMISNVATSGMAADALPWRLLVIPLAGIVIAGVFQKYILHHDIDHGTDRINEALTSRKLLLPASTIFTPIIGASVTLGLGGSAGSEGPIAYAGAAIGSRLAHFLRLSPARMAALVAIGAGAGIAGIFKAPIGGFFFVAEVLTLGLNTLTVVGLATACVAAGVTAYTLSGFTPDVAFSSIPPFEPRMLLWAIPLGLICGVYSLYYSTMMKSITRFNESLRRPWVKWVLSGATLSIILFILPSLYGEGYNVIAALLDGSGLNAISYATILRNIHGLSPQIMAIIICGAIVLAKAVGAAATNSGGGVAGDFAPTIFAGAAVGFLFASAAALILPVDVPVSSLVLMAMGGVMAGSVRAPLMAMFIVAEMTGAMSLFMPLAVTAALSYLVVIISRLRHTVS